MKLDAWVSTYAAIIATSAFFLNLKTWFDSGVKLKLSLMSDARTIGGDPEFEERDLIILTVNNRGDASTMVTGMVLFEIRSWWRLFLFKITSSISWWRRKVYPDSMRIITNPQLKDDPPNVPSALEPAKIWRGAIRQRPDIIPDMRTGNFYTGIYTTTRETPYLIRIPKPRDKLPKGTPEL